MNFQEAVEELETVGINQEEVYLIDLLPLIEIMWADGKTQLKEVEIFQLYSSKRIEEINKSAGFQVLSQTKVKLFIERHLKKAPDPEMMVVVRKVLSEVLAKNQDEKFKETLLNTALDIASANATTYPFGNSDRFNLDEKKCFFQLLSSLSK